MTIVIPILTIVAGITGIVLVAIYADRIVEHRNQLLRKCRQALTEAREMVADLDGPEDCESIDLLIREIDGVVKSA